MIFKEGDKVKFIEDFDRYIKTIFAKQKIILKK